MSNKSVYAFAVLLLLVIIGMLTGSFRLVIYPYMLIVGLLLLGGLTKKLNVNKKLIWIPTVITVLFLLLQLCLDLVTLHSPIGNGKLIFGITTSTAIYYLGIWLVCASISLIYSRTFNLPEEKQSVIETNSLDV